MAGLRQPIEDILTELAKIQVVNQDGQTVGLYSRLWNNQLERLRDKPDYIFPLPAAFVEIVGDVTFEILGQGYRSADLGIHIHLLHENLNSEGTYEQDLEILDLRDKLIQSLTGYCPTGCGGLYCISEKPDYDHDNVYHYVLSFVCNFTDSKADPLETGKKTEEIIENMDIEVQNNVIEIELPKYYVINPR